MWRRFFAIVRATALEIASEPLALLLTISSLALAVITPAMHYHQFGEPSRMARDAGLSALLMGGLAYVIFCGIKSFRREVESGTMQMALSHSVSRGMFFTAKFVGLLIAFSLFSVTIIAASLTVVNGSEIGAKIALQSEYMSPIWGVSFSLAVSTIVAPPIIAGALNRFGNFRWTLSATILSLLFSLVGSAYKFDFSLASRFLRVALMIMMPSIIFAVLALMFAVRHRENAALALTSLFFILSLPFLGNYYLSDVLVKGGSLSMTHILLAVGCTTPLVLAIVLTGIFFLDVRDLGGEK